MAPSQPCLPPQLAHRFTSISPWPAPDKSLCSAIADLSAIPFDDPFSADMAVFVEEFVEEIEMPSSLAGVADTVLRPLVYSLSPTSTWNKIPTSSTPSSTDSQDTVEHVANTRKVVPLTRSTRTSSEVSLASTTRTGSSSNVFTELAIAHDTNSSSESDTSDASEGTSSLPKRVGTAPSSEAKDRHKPGQAKRWTTQERSLFLATLPTLAHTLDSSHSSSTNDDLAETVSLVVATRSPREVRSHARRALRKLRARDETESSSVSIKTLLCIVGSSENTACELC